MFTNKVSLVSKLGKDIVIMTDDNINSIDLNSLTNQLNNNDLKTIRDDMLIDNDMIIHNDQPTFFRQNFKTCIDHIISNCPNKVTHITTYNKQHFKTNDTMKYNADSSNCPDDVFPDKWKYWVTCINLWIYAGDNLKVVAH